MFKIQCQVYWKTLVYIVSVITLILASSQYVYISLTKIKLIYTQIEVWSVQSPTGHATPLTFIRWSQPRIGTSITDAIIGHAKGCHDTFTVGIGLGHGCITINVIRSRALFPRRISIGRKVEHCHDIPLYHGVDSSTEGAPEILLIGTHYGYYRILVRNPIEGL